MREYPQWFIDELANDEDKKRAIEGTLEARDRVHFYCPVHGDTGEAYVYSHIRISDGYKICGCYLCGVKDKAKKCKLVPKTGISKEVVRNDVSKVRKFPQWFIDELWDPIDKERAERGVISSRDMVYFTCKVHGKYDHVCQVGSHIKLRSGERNRGCPKCASNNRAEANRKRWSVRSYPQWFIDELAYDEDKRKAEEGALTSMDNVDFICPKHGVYTQTVYNHINITTGERKKEGLTGCPSCVTGGFTSLAEYQVREWLKEYECEYNNRSVLKAPSGHWMELDIYLPKEYFAVECDGRHWHQESDMSYNKWQLIMRGVDKNKRSHMPKWKGYHNFKDNQCAEKGIKLVHVDSQDVIDFPDQTKAYILEELNKWQNLTKEE